MILCRGKLSVEYCIINDNNSNKYIHQSANPQVSYNIRPVESFSGHFYITAATQLKFSLTIVCSRPSLRRTAVIS